MPPPEVLFHKHADKIQKALSNFQLIRNLDSPFIVKAALTELVDATVRARVLFSFRRY